VLYPQASHNFIVARPGFIAEAVARIEAAVDVTWGYGIIV
jgi:hypothetical protein